MKSKKKLKVAKKQKNPRSGKKQEVTQHSESEHSESGSSESESDAHFTTRADEEEHPSGNESDLESNHQSEYDSDAHDNSPIIKNVKMKAKQVANLNQPKVSSKSM